MMHANIWLLVIWDAKCKVFSMHCLGRVSVLLQYLGSPSKPASSTDRFAGFEKNSERLWHFKH